MAMELKLRKIGNSVGLVLPQEVLAHLKADAGDSVLITESTDGSLRLNASNQNVSRQMKAAQSIMERYRNTLRELAQ